jgi:hypothetical protein
VNGNIPKYTCGSSSLSGDCFIICNNCCDKPQARCLKCYHLLHKALNSNLKISKRDTLICNKAAQFIKEFDEWEQAIERPTETFNGYEQLKNIDGNVFEWTIPCPCCGTVELPEEPPRLLWNN